MNEVNEIINRYKKRDILSGKYDILNPWIYKGEQEKETTLIKWIKNNSLIPVGDKTLLEIGCGNGNNLLQFIRLGFSPENLTGNELLEERYSAARMRLPVKLKIIPGNALDLDFGKQHFDIVFQSMVFSSILDDNFKINLANKMWEWVNYGGGILWYDFIYDNPFNKDVKGITLNTLKKYFPNGKIKKWKITLAPPISRKVTKLHPHLYNIFNTFPFLRTHILCWIQKNKFS